MPFDATPLEEPIALPSAPVLPAHPDRVLRALFAARKLVERDWGTGGWSSPGFCILQAIAVGAGRSRRDLYGEHDQSRQRDYLEPLWKWNDRQLDNKPVLALIDAAIERHSRTFLVYRPEAVADQCRKEVLATYLSEKG